jgi:hypothetical protein
MKVMKGSPAKVLLERKSLNYNRLRQEVGGRQRRNALAKWNPVARTRAKAEGAGGGGGG